VTHDNQSKKESGALRVDQSHLMFEKGFSFSGYERDPLYLNLGNKRFLDVSGVSGIDSISDGRAAVFADFDNDGDLDVFMTTIQGQAHLLFRNNIGRQNNYLRIQLEGSKQMGRDAFGAVVRVKTSRGVQTKVKEGGSGFISQHDPRLLFGLGGDKGAEWMEVTWPDGKKERFQTEAGAGSSLLLRQGSGRAKVLVESGATLPEPLTRTEAFTRGLKIGVGRPIADFALQTLDGKQMSLHKLLRSGRRALINVWATWCLPCAREMPELERLRLRFAANGVDLIGLNVDTEPGADVRAFLREKRVRYPNLIGGVAAVEQLYATDELSVPMSLVVDDKGIVMEVIPGWSGETQRRFQELAGSNAKRVPRRR
jgi:thiol-disulfide isomerase/thioredoxin